MTTTLQFKRGLEADFTSVVLAAGEPAFVLDSGKLYIGNGTEKVLINETFGTAAKADLGVAQGNVPVLDADGKLNASVIPAMAITEVYVVASEVEMLALNAHVGDVAIRTDVSETYILGTDPATVVANWIKLPQASGYVTSVAGKSGDVTLVIGDIDGLQAALDTKAPLNNPVFTGDPKAPTKAAGDSSTSIATTEFVAEAISTGAPVTSVNTKVGAVVLGGKDILATDYTKPASGSAILPTDSINVALGKLEAKSGSIDGGNF